MTLSETWFIENNIDFEYQKYRLLAYLKKADRHFSACRLYPQLADLVFHYNNLQQFLKNKKWLQDQFPQQLNQVSVEKLQLVYEQMLSDDGMMQELESIINFAADHIKRTLDDGAGIYEFVAQRLSIEPVGILPLYKQEGYLLLHYGGQKEVRAYAYNITLFERNDARYKGLRLKYVSSWTKTPGNTYQHIKREVIRQHPELPQPCVYLATTDLALPLEDTLLPVARRSFIRYVTHQQA